MSVRRLADDHLQPEGFQFNRSFTAEAKKWVKKYPKGREQSAVIPLLMLAQEQDGWVTKSAIEYVADMLDMPFMRAYEVATFYTMYNLAPVGRYHVQVCGTTPCMLRGSDDVMAACKNKGMVKGKTTPDGMFTLTEVECMGNCATAPMFQINDDNYEDLTYDSACAILEALAKGEQPKTGSQIAGRQSSEPEGGVTSLAAMVDSNHDYRKDY
jgi:NADH-quinone oxidoreductase subunit E